MKIYLDDCRQEPQGWTRTLKVEETIALLARCQESGQVVEIVSLDNDLGLGLAEGRKVLDWLEEQRHYDPSFILPEKVVVHSANPVARQRMETVIERLYRK